VFGEVYGGANETRFANDIADVVPWIDGGKEPRTIRDANLAPTRLLTLQTRQSAAYKGMMALLMQIGSNDFINGDSIELTTYFDQAVDIHHIFPRSHCEKVNYPRQKWNSVVNKAPPHRPHQPHSWRECTESLPREYRDQPWCRRPSARRDIGNPPH
jgi:hypothetical protein